MRPAPASPKMHGIDNSTHSSRFDMDRFQAMAPFVTVVETGGFAAAARKMEVSPSVVSRVVTELEEHLGVRLLTRTTRVVRLTDAGSGYFEDCRRILGEVGHAKLSAAGPHSAPRGLLSLTAPTMFGRLHVTPVVLDYLRHYPEADVNCWFVDRVVNLVDGRHRHGGADRAIVGLDLAGDSGRTRAARAVRIARVSRRARHARASRRSARKPCRSSPTPARRRPPNSACMTATNRFSCAHIASYDHHQRFGHRRRARRLRHRAAAVVSDRAVRE